jgi:predicted dehydrogenase
LSTISRSRSTPPRGSRTGHRLVRVQPTSPSLDELRVGIVGYGYWGPNLARNFNEAGASTLVAVSDARPERLRDAQSRYPAINVYTDCQDLFADPAVEAVVIATPLRTHYPLALAALNAGKHVLVEKPLAGSSEQALRLIDTAEKLDRVLMVDHTFLYSGAVRKIKELVQCGDLGRLYYYDSVRVNLGMFQHDVSVLWDLAVHDLSIMEDILQAEPRAVTATGVAHFPGQPVNMAYLTCFFDNRLIAHLHVNWLAPVKIRRTLIGGDRKMIVYDDVEPSEKVKVYDKGLTLTAGDQNGQNGQSGMEGARELLVSYRTGDVLAPQLGVSEALANVAQHFAECVRHGSPPLTDGAAGLRVVRILEAAEQSLIAGGAAVELR